MRELVDLEELRLVPSAGDSPVDSSRFQLSLLDFEPLTVVASAGEPPPVPPSLSELLDFDDLTVVASWGCPTPSFTVPPRTSSARMTLAIHSDERTKNRE